MSKRYGVYYRDLLAEVRITRVKAESRAYELAKAKGWEFTNVQVKEIA